MNDLLTLIYKGENESLEFKESLRLKEEIGQAVSAFSTANGGSILIGVSDEGTIIGIDIGRNTLEELANYIKRNTDPAIFPSVKILDVEGKKIIVIDVKESAEKPVFFKKHAYKRVGKTNQRISSSEMRKLAKESGERVYWDEQVCEEAKLEDIDEEKVKSYLEKRQEIRGVKKPLKMDLKTLLLNIKAAKEVNGEIRMTNAGILFFAENPQRFVLQSQLRLARFAGKELTRDFLDRLDCSGAIWEQIEQAEDFIRRNIRLFGFRTGFSFGRIDKLEYPMKAIREGVINALIHRNYYEPADTRVMIFDDRIEIVNPGSFPEGVTPEKPRHIPVNPVLCQLMYDVGFIEKYGTGIYIIKELCEEYGIPGPEYEISDVETKLVFRSGGKAVVISEIEKLGVELNERQSRALKYAFREGFITNRIYREINKVSDETSRKELVDIVEKGLLSITGKGRGVKYVPTLGD
ncbi:MAG: putative DNA binding domain-containing protein [Thermodesulfobacteriota bacterium]|nr:putative DNA binding domain-containing protein [Thermodesulfobacteriota bacterium]